MPKRKEDGGINLYADLDESFSSFATFGGNLKQLRKSVVASKINKQTI